MWHSRFRTVAIVGVFSLCGALTGWMVAVFTGLAVMIWLGVVGGMWLGSKAARPG